MTIALNPHEFARAWMKAWNDHDIEAVLTHFRNDAVFTSPLACQMGHGANGVVTGKVAIREYWAAALQLNPGLRFTTKTIYAGVDVIVINFTTQDEIERSEVLLFEDGLVTEGYGTIAAAAA